MSTETKPVSEIEARFTRETAKHEMAVRHDDGLYRHLRFSEAGNSFYWFDLVTWPGTLVINGDCGTFVFSRVTDMFTFFRGAREINPSYWGEKTPGGVRSVREYSEDTLKALLAAEVAEYEDGYPDLRADYERDQARYDAAGHAERYPLGDIRKPVEPKTLAEVRELIQDYDDEGRLAYESGARELLSELETARVVSETWEWDMGDWEWSFLWCCHAIVWGIAQYDASRVPPAPTPESGETA